MRIANQTKLAAAAIAAALVLPTPALAATSSQLQAELNDARAVLDGMYDEMAEQEQELSETRAKLDDTNAALDKIGSELGERQDELADARMLLSKRVKSNYKNGSVSFLSILLQSSSFEELLSNIYYADKISERDAKSIEAVDKARVGLENEKQKLARLQSEHAKLVAEQEQHQEALEEAQAEQAAYVSGLSAEVQRVVEQERAAELARQEAERKAAEEAERKAAQEKEDAAKDEEASEENEEAVKDDDTKAEEEDSKKDKVEETDNVDEASEPKEDNKADEDKTSEKEPDAKKDEKPAPKDDDATDAEQGKEQEKETPAVTDWKPEYDQSNYPHPSVLCQETTPDYDAWRANWIANNIRSSMSTYDKVVAVSNFVSSFPRDRAMRNFTGINMYRNGMGTCSASSDMVKSFMDDLGIPCVIRNADNSADPHNNNYVWVDGVRYIVDANPGYYGAIQPRLG